MGTDLSSLGHEIARMINLVTFDACDVSALHIADTVNPLVKEIRAPLRDTIHPDLHKHIRATTKKMCKRADLLAGKITLEHQLVIVIYLKRRVTPAWLRASPQDAPSSEEPTDQS